MRNHHHIRATTTVLLTRLTAVVGLLLSGLLLSSSAVAAADDGHFSSPKRYYLALGDPQAFGFQLAKFQQEILSNSYNPASFDTGHVDDFAAMLRGIRPHIQVVNFSCAGETTATLIDGTRSIARADRWRSTTITRFQRPSSPPR